VKRLDYSEPSVLRGILTAVFALVASLGFVATDDVKGAAEALIPVAAFLIPLVQSWWTRQSVYSPATHNEQLGKAAAGLTDGPA
jgi:hypothetical protein